MALQIALQTLGTSSSRFQIWMNLSLFSGLDV